MNDSSRVVDLAPKATRVLEYNGIAVYFASSEEGIQCLFQSDVQSVSMALSRVEVHRDDLEKQRDRARREDKQAGGSLQSVEKIQNRIDVYVIIERATKFVREDSGPKQSRHYRRVSALCDEPTAIFENVEKVLESAEAKHQGSGLSSIASRWLSKAGTAAIANSGRRNYDRTQ